ncbi:acriflavin resistance protein [bacterium J17]|nr:acriflavin resistance protein [bacterium J17]
MNKAIEWMTRNHVAANLAMMLLIVGGLLFGQTVKREVFPEIELDSLSVSAIYPGAGPAEVESGICLPVEEAIASISGVKELRCIATEGAGTVTAELQLGYDADEVLQEVKSEVDRIQTFPEEAEAPSVSRLAQRTEVLSVAMFGEVDERSIREQAEIFRDELLTHPRITQVELGGVRNYEISIEISEQDLQRYGLSLGSVANRIRRASVDVAGGRVRTSAGEILLRTKERRYSGEEYGNIRIMSLPDGGELLLSDIANVRDEFEESDEAGLFDSKPAVMINVFRLGDQGPIEVSNIVRELVKNKQKTLPDSISLEVWDDRSLMFASRMQLLLDNAYMGLILVLIILGLFLEVRLAFWVTLGIPISFLGALFFMPAMDVSINMISLFAFILSLGIVVDDAIIVGENIYERQLHEKDALKAATEGTIEVSSAVIFSVLTSVAAFMPMLFIGGMMGKFMGVIPKIVIAVLLISLFESLFILPAHLYRSAEKRQNARRRGRFQFIVKRIDLVRLKLSSTLDRFITNRYRPLVDWAVGSRATVLAGAVSLFLVALGLVFGGYVKVSHLPAVDSDIVRVDLKMPIGTPVERTSSIRKIIEQKGQSVIQSFKNELGDDSKIVQHIYSVTGAFLKSRGHGQQSQKKGSHLASIAILLESSDTREFSSQEFARRWRELVGEIAGVDSLVFSADLIPMGENINIQLEHDDYEILIDVADQLKSRLRQFAGVGDVGDNFSEGKDELKFSLKPQARTLGITEIDLGMQVRSAFYGAEALRILRGREEVKVMVRYPESDRVSLSDLESLRIRTSNGGEIPFKEVAYIESGQGYSQVRRANRRRVVNVTASVEEKIANVSEVVRELKNNLLAELERNVPGLSITIEGEEKERQESLSSLSLGFLFASLVIYALLAIPFKSYLQPLIVMTAIPFGFVGATLGHFILGRNLSLLSMCGLIALSGVVVNDSLILVDYVNKLRAKGMSLKQAIVEGGCRRFRPIVLTSLTTFCGLIPIILETSVQAQFLIPMAISLAFGILFATFITLLLIPALYSMSESLKQGASNLQDFITERVL